jgi:hypothetical protein
LSDEFSDPDVSTRRGLLGAFARSAARHARERARILPAPDVAAPEPMAAPLRQPARVPERAASVDDLLALAHEEGLTERDDALRALARRSLRMTAIDAPQADAWIVTGANQGGADDTSLRAVIRLGSQGDELPHEGWLALFVDPGDGAAESEATRAHGVVLETSPASPDGAEPVALHPELVLPRRWHEAVDTLDLDDAESDAYMRLRTRLQNLQGVESDDGGLGIAYHRLLGYPNETTGNMPGQCVRALEAWSAADGLDSDPALPSHDWRLLLQTSVGERQRAYLWIHRADLEAGRFDRLCAFLH